VVNTETGLIDELIQEILREQQEQGTTRTVEEQLAELTRREQLRNEQAQHQENHREIQEYLDTGFLEAGEEQEIINDYYKNQTPVPGTPNPLETPSNLNRDINLENTLADYFDFAENLD
jgi:hypothetical protein